MKVIQPDITKRVASPVAHSIYHPSALYCPYYLGGGIGLLGSANLLVAVGGDGMLEIDTKENPLRQEWCGPLNTMNNGYSLTSAWPRKSQKHCLASASDGMT